MIDAASAARSISSGYSAAIAENVDAATALTPTIQISNEIRSRRRFSRISTHQTDQLTPPGPARPVPDRPATAWSSWSFRTTR